MRKWIKRSMLGIALALTLLALFLTGGFVLLRGTPAYYRKTTLSVAQLAEAAARAESKLSQLQNLAVDSHSAEIQQARGTTRPATAPGSRSFSFTEDELNAVFNKWADLHGWKDAFSNIVEDPMLVLQNGRVILAGKVNYKNVDTILSIHFLPTITPESQLDLKLDSILGGKLPLPDSVIASARQKTVAKLAAAMPEMQRKAGISPEGAANEDAVKALLSQLLLHTLNNQPSEPVIFLPLFTKGNGMAPFRVSEVTIADSTLTFSVIPMSATERAALLQEIKKPIAFEQAAARD